MIPVLGVVEAEEAVRPLLQNLLGHTVIAPDWRPPGRRWRECAGAFDFVTPGRDAGPAWRFHGAVAQEGNGSGKATGFHFGRKNQIAELRTAAAALQEA